MATTRYIGIPILSEISEKYSLKNKINSRAKLDFTNIIELRKFCEKYNLQNDLILNSRKQFKPAELFASMIISGLQEKILNRFYTEINKHVEPEITQQLKKHLGEFYLSEFDKHYRENFVTKDNSKLFKETILIWLANRNPATRKYLPLFSESSIKLNSKFTEHFHQVTDYFAKQPRFSGYDEDILTMLLKPFRQHPDSLSDQLKFIRNYWKDFIDDELDLLLRSLDLIKEENKSGFTGPGPTYLPEFDATEYEKFTEDKDWMPNLILIAKSTYVWLDQLSRKYKRQLEKLDQIPEEELRLQASRGINGIWLIGIWERSAASAKIKEINGDRDAIASAYSLEDYRIATDLGGEEALQSLKQKANRFGIRLGCDMVPNHTGIDSRWIEEHPDWFLQLDHPPFPSYAFNGMDLTEKTSFSVYIEDHYYDKNDAAVVFKHVDNQDGRTRYIYHGNDGTSTPWNDTAQLNYLLPEVRKAVTDKIVSIAKKFPVIRFDAAMTLAKKHIQRLWFPPPGQGGDIPSRSQFGMTTAEFNRKMPQEFWREVVDRIAAEAPDTLLLAEAFWMMEGYFVRTLGMHRVYNSAFMNMLKSEENAKYRKTIFNILEFNPQILKRFVNFMSNPDEETAIEQFGKDDKYFGVCILMSTLPGLPMFAHGQIEGYKEKYGMEFSRAKWQENEDEQLIARHNREIFPILNKRYLFSGVENFHLFDFNDNEFGLNENVFAYSNEHKGERSLVVYNNKYQRTCGNLQWTNVPFKEAEGTVWKRIDLGSVLHLHNSPQHYVIFRNMIDDLQYIRNSAELTNKGLYMELDAFKYAVYTDFYEVEDNLEKDYSALHKYLAGKGTKDIRKVLKKIKLMPLLKKFRNYIRSDVIDFLANCSEAKELETFKGEFLYRTREFLEYLNKWENFSGEPQKVTKAIYEILKKYPEFKTEEKSLNISLILWIMLKELGRLHSEKNYYEKSYDICKELCFTDELEDLLEAEFDLINSKLVVEKILLALLFQDLAKELNAKNEKEILQSIFLHPELRAYLAVHEYDDKLWFNKERFEESINFLKLTNLLNSKNKTHRQQWQRFTKKLLKKSEKSGYQLEKLLEL